MRTRTVLDSLPNKYHGLGVPNDRGSDKKLVRILGRMNLNKTVGNQGTST